MAVQGGILDHAQSCYYKLQLIVNRTAESMSRPPTLKVVAAEPRLGMATTSLVLRQAGNLCPAHTNVDTRRRGEPHERRHEGRNPKVTGHILQIPRWPDVLAYNPFERSKNVYCQPFRLSSATGECLAKCRDLRV